MFKAILLASTMFIAGPGLAQELTPQDSTASEATTGSGVAPESADTAVAAPDQAATAAPRGTPAPATQTASPAPAQPAPTQSASAATQPATSGEQVAQVVDQGFPSYDKNADGNLTKDEFASWMGSLRSASEPGFDANATASKEWSARAFAQADADKSKSVSKAELTTFLTPAAS